MPRFRMACLFPIAEQVTADGSPGRLTHAHYRRKLVTTSLVWWECWWKNDPVCVALSDNTAAETFPAS